MSQPSEHVAVRLDQIVIARIEALSTQISQPGRDATRTDVLRKLILRGLEHAEKDPAFLRDPQA
jgi:hypothetical protein